MTRKFLHELVVCKSKGKFKAYCRCDNFQTPKLATEREVQTAYTAHLTLSGIMERKAKISFVP